MSMDIYDRGPIGSFTKEHLIECTREWTGERFPDGRPKVPDDIIERMRGVTLTQAWGSCGDAEFDQQFESGFINTQPEHVLCGRAVSATFMPRRRRSAARPREAPEPVAPLTCSHPARADSAGGTGNPAAGRRDGRLRHSSRNACGGRGPDVAPPT